MNICNFLCICRWHCLFRCRRWVYAFTGETFLFESCWSY